MVSIKGQKKTGSDIFDDPDFINMLDDHAKSVLAKIKSRSDEEIIQGLIRTGVLEVDGKTLTKKYGGK